MPNGVQYDYALEWVGPLWNFDYLISTISTYLYIILEFSLVKNEVSNKLRSTKMHSYK